MGAPKEGGGLSGAEQGSPAPGPEASVAQKHRSLMQKQVNVTASPSRSCAPAASGPPGFSTLSCPSRSVAARAAGSEGSRDRWFKTSRGMRDARMVTPCTFVTVSPALADLVAPPGEPASVHTPAGTAPDPRDPAASGLSCPEDAPTSRAVCAASAPPPTWPGLPVRTTGRRCLKHARGKSLTGFFTGTLGKT